MQMQTIMHERCLQLTLAASQSIPTNICWHINSGYLITTSASTLTDTYTLGIWGPGEIVIPDLLTMQSIELRTLSNAVISEWAATNEERTGFSANHIEQMSKLLQLAKIRPVETRLLKLLLWLGERFGTTTDEGIEIPIDAMNLTHRQLAELASVSRVTVTKTLGHFRQQGWLSRAGTGDLITHLGVISYQQLV